MTFKWVALSGVFPFVLAVSLASWESAAQPADQWYEPKQTYKSAGLPEKDTPEAACKASAADLNAHDQTRKETYVSHKNGSSAFSITCMLRDKTGKVWPQDNNVTRVFTCDDGSSAVSWNNSGTVESQKCRCDPAKGCPKNKQALPPPVFACPESNRKLDACKDREERDANETKRCTQQPERNRTRKEIMDDSKANKDGLSSNRQKRAAIDKYNAALDDIRKDERNKREMRTGVDQKGTEFPKFKQEDMCPTGLPTDINIGSLCGNREDDFAAANNLVGHSKTPPDCVWHHHEELGRMQLVKKKAHESQPHTGGVAVWKQAFGVDYPLCCPAKRPAIKLQNLKPR
jgi:hypothetical protein